jgi:hypothetical protein
LKPSDVVILDNLSSHKRPATRVLIEAAGAKMVFPPPYTDELKNLAVSPAGTPVGLRPPYVPAGLTDSHLD